MKYQSGEEIRQGDGVLYGGQPGEIQFVMEKPIRTGDTWNDPLNWHTRDGHTFRERKARAQETVFPEVPAHGCRADGDLRGHRRVGQGARGHSAVPLQVAAQA